MVSNSFVFTNTANRELNDILFYIAVKLKNPIAAKNFFEKLNKKISYLCLFPESCPRLDNDLVVNINARKAFVGNYIVYYLFDTSNNMVVILRIVYAKRNLNEIIKELTK